MPTCPSELELCVSKHARHRKPSHAMLLGPVVVIAAAGAAIVAAHDPSDHSSRPAADIQQLGPAAPLAPFAATPYVTPIDPPPAPVVVAAKVVRQHKHKKAGPAASAPIVTLPAHLDVTASTIPRRVLASYVNAAKLADKADAQCQLRWQTLAGIGFIESDHARSGGSDNPHWNGVANPPILGPVLDGQGGVGSIPDTDDGLLDGNTQWDRAVGPMQFIPSTWARYAADGNHDGIKNPEQIDDATLAAADYLCATGPDLNTPKPLISAIYAYNHSYIYVKAVLTVEAHYMNINPAKLGINGLPKAHKHKHHAKVTVIAPTAPSPTPTPSTSPTSSPTPTTSPSPSPSTSASPTPWQSPSPTPTTAPSGGVRPSPPPRL
jgi:membrane-bound lytic murein transglycosylase B